jgi:dTDP-4-amino-4,6-dideoxygalactose transaminase
MKKFHVNFPYMNKPHFERLIKNMFERGIYSNNGPLVRQFEDLFAIRHEVKHAIAVSNATMGLQIVAKAMGLTGEVIMPAYTFVATAHALSWIGLKPVFADVELDTHNISRRTVEPLITENTSAILGVHLLGIPADPMGLGDLVSERNIKLFYDAAHAVDCAYKGTSVGNFGHAEVFSTHATKILNSFEGGVITTNDGYITEKCRLMRNFGFKDVDIVVSQGINAKMSEIHAAMGIANLRVLDDTINYAELIYKTYKRNLEDIPGIKLWEYIEDPYGQNFNYQYVVIEVDNDCFAFNGREDARDSLMKHLRSCDILARRYFWPGVQWMSPYRNKNQIPNFLPNTEKLCANTLFLPSGGNVSESDVVWICEVIKRWALL